MKFRRLGMALCLAGMIALPCMETKAYYENSGSTYIYNQYAMAIETPDAYEFSRSVDLRYLDGFSVTSVTDMCVQENGSLYILETNLGVIFTFDEKQNYKGYLQEFTLPDGSTTTLNKPEGIFVSEDNVMYVADTGNSRVLVSDLKGNVSLVVVRPENILGSSVDNFLPIKAVADTAGRINIVARNVNSGIMQFSSEGIFAGYMGAPSVSVDAFSKLMRKFYTDEQRAATTTFVPTEYNNIKIDSGNFIWGTISAISMMDLQSAVNSGDVSGAVTPIKRLNMKGKDVLIRNGDYAPLGDLQWMETPSKIVDVGLGPNNMYSMLDSTMGHIFTYNNSGILLYAFCNKGTAKGETQTPVAIDYVGNNILVLDSGLCSLLVYEPTAYGSLLIDAEGYYMVGDYNNANELWKQVTELNSNFTYPYIGLGNAEYNSGNYEDAMEYFEYAEDRVSYSNAKEKLRKEGMAVMFPYIMGALVLFVLLFIGKRLFVRIRRYVKGEITTYGKDEE